MGTLVIIAPTFVGSLAGLSLLVWVVFALFRRTGRRVLVALSAIVAFVLTVTTAAGAVNAHYGYFPRFNDLVGQPTWSTSHYDLSTRSVISPSRPTAGARALRGTVVRVRIAGSRSGFRGASTLVYLPPDYLHDESERFPVVYLLHGSPGVPIDWFRSDRASDVGDRLSAAGTPVILVAPPVSSGWLDDSECVDRPSEHIEQYLIDDVVPRVDSLFRTTGDPRHRSVGGVSAGGFCALNIGLRHQDVFGSVIDLSGYDHPTHDQGMVGLFGARDDIVRIAEENDPSRYVEHLDPAPFEQLWLDCGREDHTALVDITSIATKLEQRHFTVQVHLRPGGHDHNVWRSALGEALAWNAREMWSAPVAAAA